MRLLENGYSHEALNAAELKVDNLPVSVFVCVCVSVNDNSLYNLRTLPATITFKMIFFPLVQEVASNYRCDNIMHSDSIFSYNDLVR